MKKVLSLLGLLVCLAACTNKEVPVIDYVFFDDYDSYKIINYANLNEYFDIKSVNCELEENNLFIDIELEKNQNQFKCEISKLRFFKYANIVSFLNKHRYTFNVEVWDKDNDEVKSTIKILNAEHLFDKELKKGETFTLKCQATIKG